VSIKETLIQKLHDKEKSRPRSTQTEVGPSEIGGCATKVWHRVNQTEETNFDTLKLASMMGTAIHSMIEDAFQGDPRYVLEEELEYNGIMGHVDLIDTETNTIWDWKTTTKKSLAYFGSNKQYESQIQLYAYIANMNGIPIEWVGLVAISRDGNELDIVEKVLPYDESVALKALERYAHIKSLEEPPAPEKEASFCADYCQFYGACEGIQYPSNEALIENIELIEMIEDYTELQNESKKIAAQLDYIKTQLTGTNGITPDGTTVRWSEVSGRSSIDEDEVMKKLGYLPKKTGQPSKRFTIKPTKG